MAHGPEHFPMKTLHSRIATLLLIPIIADGKIWSHLDWGEFFLSETASGCARVTQGDRKLGEGGPRSIYIRKKSHRLHPDPSKPFFLPNKKSHISTGVNFSLPFCQKQLLSVSESLRVVLSQAA